MLCAAQALVAAAPARPARTRGVGAVGLLVPAALLAAGVAIVNLVAWGPDALAWVATFGTPALAAAGGLAVGRGRWWLWPPAAAALWLVAWQAHGLLRDGAGLLLIGAACLAAASFAGRVAPAWSLRLGLVALAILDVVLVWGTTQVRETTTALHAVALPHAAGTPLPRLQDATFGSALMGWLDLLAPALLGVVLAGRARLAAAAVVGVAAGLWGLLLFVTSEVAATVPTLAGLAFAASNAGRRRLRHPREPRGARGGARGRRRGRA
ncbi:MAG TPA: hypothetical protein VFJ77_06660 [Gaiellaceae bacterium]|nr:hypothetical protein [Gaiellaceae bacterium]